MNVKHKQKLILGRKIKYLERCIEVNELLQKHESHTTVRKRVFEEFIRPTVRISYTQFNNILNEKNPVKQLEEIIQKYNSL